MIVKLANLWAHWITQNGGDLEQKEVYAYGAECLLSELLSDAILLAAGLLMHRLPEMLVWLLFFTPLRIQAGGFHASSHFSCIVYSTVIGIACVLACPYLLRVPMAIGVAFVLCAVVLAKIAPVVHPNHPIPAQKHSLLRRNALALFGIGVVLTIAFYYFGAVRMAGAAAAGILAAVLLSLIGKLFQMRSSL